MAERVLMSGNEAIAEGAIRAGCDSYFGYPITPQNELTAYMADHMQRRGRVFVQAESELASISMVYGAAAAGKRAMTSSSSPGISLMQEGISYLAGAELPAVIVNVQRGGPGLGNIAPAQSDYWQSTRGGGHGDYRTVVLAPYSVQEMHDLTILAFAIADEYRLPVIIHTDGRLGQMMEPLNLCAEPAPPVPEKPWALTGATGREPNIVRSLYLPEGQLEETNLRLQSRHRQIEKDEVRDEQYRTDDCEVLIVAYGTCARIACGAVDLARDTGLKAGLLRPITLWPFPSAAIRHACDGVRHVLVVEMSLGQMIEDVQLALGERVPISLLGRTGGGIPSVADVVDKMRNLEEGRS